MMQTLDVYNLLNNDQLSLTNPCNELHYSERAANKVDAQCDKVDNTNFRLPNLHFT